MENWQQLETVTIDLAARILGGDKPLSHSTVSRYVRRGLLDRTGAGGATRITVPSIIRYLSGAPPARAESSGASSTPTVTVSPGRRARKQSETPPVTLVAREPKAAAQPKSR